MRSLILITTAFTLALTGAVSAIAADQEVGKVVAARGQVTIARQRANVEAKVKTGILSSDTVKTAADARAKLLFIDDSVLTLSEKSQLVVQEFIHEKGKVGASVFNLLDGKMRSVVGKTKFDVKTPTAVASARGTVILFDVGTKNNRSYSRIICLEGKVEVRSILPNVKGSVLLTPGKMVVVHAGAAPPPPTTAPRIEMDNGSNGSSSQVQDSKDSSVTPNEPKPDEPPPGPPRPPQVPKIIDQPRVGRPTKVIVTIPVP